MAKDLRAKRDQKAWQAIEQNHTEGRGRFERAGLNQPKPRVGRRQTAQSVPRGCQHRSLEEIEEGIGHAALLVACSSTAARIAGRFHRKFRWQLAAYFERPKSSEASA